MSNSKAKFKSKKVIISITTLLILIILFLGVFTIKPLFDKSIEDSVKYYYNNISQVVGYEPVGWGNTEENKFIYVCDYNNLTNPDILFVQEGESYSRIQYFQPTRNNLFSQTWSIDKYEGYKGHALVYNFKDFNNLTDLAKSDCNQFKQGYPSSTNPKKEDLPEDIRWVYYRPQTEEEKQAEIERQKQEEIEEAEMQKAREYVESLYKNTNYTHQETLDAITSIEPTDEDMEFMTNIFSKEDNPFEYTEEEMQKWINYLLQQGYLEPKE